MSNDDDYALQLFPLKYRDNIPALNETAQLRKDEIQAVVKFFIPESWIWYVIEYNGDNIFYGYVVGDFPEFGSFTLYELAVLFMIDIPIQIDPDFKPTPMQDILNLHR